MKTENMRVMRAQFEVLTTLKDDVFTRKGKIRKKLQKGVTDLLRFEAHKFIDSLEPEDIIRNSTIEYEEVEVDEN